MIAHSAVGGMQEIHLHLQIQTTDATYHVYKNSQIISQGNSFHKQESWECFQRHPKGFWLSCQHSHLMWLFLSYSKKEKKKKNK